jgi:hypothetical protein
MPIDETVREVNHVTMNMSAANRNLSSYSSNWDTYHSLDKTELCVVVLRNELV